MDTFHIHLQGIVQGVGFRPLVYQQAQNYGLRGWVNNTNDGVHIEINATGRQAQEFYRFIVANPPRLAVITNHTMARVANRDYASFTIIESGTDVRPNLPLTPDYALCDDCRNDIATTTNRRHNYAFTTCTNCGPRYSIITALPYDRPHTTMAVFAQCPDCAQEYNNPLDRRHFSQTNSCPACGIALFSDHETKTTIPQLVTSLRQGNIIAVKGIGGFLLLCDAGNRRAIDKLRQRKNRPAKPFAVMYPDLPSVKTDFCVSKTEEQWLTNEVSPIVLLKPRPVTCRLAREAIAPGLKRLGCMLPYAPLFHLLLQGFRQPVVATSGNISGSPIIYTNQQAATELAGIADRVVYHTRDIVIPQDDSVMVFSEKSQQKILLRRSRGLAPTLLKPGFTLPDNTILAVGAQMKSSFAFTNKGLLYVSQYLGDMDNYLTQTAYDHTVKHFFKVFQAHPQRIAGDLHPGYFTTQYGHDLAREYAVPFVGVQHHKAHFFAVLAENKLLARQEPVLGVIWDGTGYGEDGQIWGGEFFVYHHGRADRVAHIPYFPFILGNKMPREPRISALAIMPDSPLTAAMFTKTEHTLYTRMLLQPTLHTSSMGRLFDAVAALTLGVNKTSYEGEAAMLLETAATSWFDKYPIADTPAYAIDSRWENILVYLSQQIAADLKAKEPAGKIAARFHLFLTELIKHQARQQNSRRLAFSGGVFQNNLLVDLLQEILGGEFALYFHQQLPANDECISFGQLAYVVHHTDEISAG